MQATTYYAGAVGCESFDGTTPEEAAWRFLVNHPRKRVVSVDGWASKPDGSSEHVGRFKLTRADVRRAIPGALNS